VHLDKGTGRAEGPARSEEMVHHAEAGTGAELGLSERWIRAAVEARKRGDEGLRHGLRGRPSNRKTPEKVKPRVVELFREKKQAKQWHDYGPTLAAEEFAADYGIEISRESQRKWLIEAKPWRAKRSRVEQVQLWCPRRARYGELLQRDTSRHHWLEGRGTKLHLISMSDDATSELARRTCSSCAAMWSGIGVRWRSTPTKPACFRSRREPSITGMLPRSS
jgi:hypothetical protein